jgi:hypothetical protein
MPVLPEVGSTITLPGRRRPSASAASIIARPMRSLTEPAGFIDSSFPRMVAPVPSPMRPRRTRGVRPIRSVMDSAMGTAARLPAGRAQTATPAARVARSAWGRAPRWEITSAAASDPRAAHSARGRSRAMPCRKPAA